VVLSACSTFFAKLLTENPCKHPIIIMPPEVAFADLQFIIEFVYRGEIDVSEAELQVSRIQLCNVDLEKATAKEENKNIVLKSYARQKRKIHTYE
jgi:hypothetical protein